MSPEGFKTRSAQALRDKHLGQAINNATQRFAEARVHAFSDEDELNALREQGRQIKDAALHNLPLLLHRLEQQVTARGGRVFHAADAQAANDYILGVARRKYARIITKSKSMTTEEIDLARILEEDEIEVVETDLGERIIQLAREKPAHIIIPAIHKTRKQVSELFHRKLGVPKSESIDELTKAARATLRKKFLQANIGITGGNFLVAETGTLVIVENEGNARLTTALPKTHIAVVGIEKVIEKMSDLPTMLKLLTRSATGQRISSYISLITGPRRAGEPDGAEEFHLVLLDNGRRRIHRDAKLREVLRCIRCGACLNVCPVYKLIGGHAYGGVYPGPIGSIVTPLLGNENTGTELPSASSLCGACKDVCPVKIDLPRLLLLLRARLANRAPAGLFEQIAFKAWALAMGSPRRFALARKVARKFYRLTSGRVPYPLSGWTESRTFPEPAEQSFREWWETEHERRH